MLAGLAQQPSLRHRSLLAVLASGLLLAWTSEAFAYRPFDGTDAAVADPGEVEIELQPAGAQWSREQNLLIAPAVVYNYGFLENWEAILEGQLQTSFSPSGPNESGGIGSFPQTHYSPGLASGSDRSQHRYGVRCSAAGQQWGQPFWSNH